MVEIFIENIIASATISSGLDLVVVAQTLPNCEYNPDRFSGAVFRPDDPPVVILLFNNGKIMVTAAKSVADVESGMKNVESKLKDAGLIQPIEKDGAADKEQTEKKTKSDQEQDQDEDQPEPEETDAEEKKDEKDGESGEEEDLMN